LERDQCSAGANDARKLTTQQQTDVKDAASDVTIIIIIMAVAAAGTAS